MRNGFVGLLLVTLASLIHPTGLSAEDRMPLHWAFAGALLQFTDGSAVVQVDAIGWPGRATIRAATRPGPPDVAPDLDGCFEGASLKLTPTSNDIVVTLVGNLSLLHGGLDTTRSSRICIDTASGRAEAALYVAFHGGTGRFEGATGRGVIHVTAVPAAPGSLLAAETGTLTGWVVHGQ